MSGDPLPTTAVPVRTSGPAPLARAVRVVICDDQAPYRFFLRSLLEQHRDMVVVGEGWHGGQAIELCRDSQPDVLIVDLDMPVMDGFTAIERVRMLAPETRIIVLTGNDLGLVGTASTRAGADRTFAKTVAPDEIVAALRELAQVGPA